ncbi:hypothetical protein HPB51_011079 [Rhipicephalus microplus]|uniref:SOCS box domain-containing protein n=1 Tax=Rhipicephalus microplus TaxID=6941 RepID=A0A9J6DUM0_RHIMP|nr:ankyrin repeat, PH and SEC7 domain containing protein secG-like [Rhipicephalus microplus]KAH8025748.1 hypothetical protein HPB51_011079 [Rhipicephalus microplus]
MPTAPCLQTLQRELADSIIRLAPLDELRILLACGARVNEPVTQGLRPLHYAAYQQYDEAVQLLLVRGCDVDAMDDVGYTALHLCAERGFLHTAETLVCQGGARVCFTNTTKPMLGNPPRATLADEPLRLAVKNGHYDCADMLLRHGANPNARYFLGAEINLVGPLNVSFLELLLRYGAEPDARDRGGLTPLMKAARHPHGLEAVQLLLKYGANANAMAPERHDRRTVLHYAVLSGNLSIVRLLLDNGAKARMEAGYRHPSPLDFAILRGDLSAVKLLLDAGADVNAGSPIVGSPLHLALSERCRDREALVRLLLERGADPNGLTYASESGERGAPLVQPPLGEYLCGQEEEPRGELIRLLLRYGARVVLRPQTKDPLGILRAIRGLRGDALDAVLEAAEACPRAAVERSLLLLGPEAKDGLVALAARPQPLKHQARLCVRRMLGAVGPELVQKVLSLDVLPSVLRRYLLYEL